MNRLLLIVCMFSFLNVAGQKTIEELFVDQDWLLNQMKNEDIVILHIGTEEDYNTGHIEGARLVTASEFSTTNGNLRWELPGREQFAQVMESKGVSRRSINVIYYGNSIVAPAFRLYFTMRYYGLDRNTFILDGGLPGWYSKKRPISSKMEKDLEPNGFLYLFPNNYLLADKDEVLGTITDSTKTIIDARRSAFYTGETDGDGYYKRSGHIAGAKNITWIDLFDNNKFIKLPMARSEFSRKTNGSDVITYCHVGLRASVLFVLSEGLGYRSKLYDGSYNEWDTLSEEYPIQKGN